ncbi:MAG: DUF1731 domain-containing protein, partial [Phycisphaerales bacterium JB059]
LVRRKSDRVPDGVDQAIWDGRSLGEWARVLDGARGVVNLVGRSVDCRKTPDHCDEILRSRVEATGVLGAAVRGAATVLKTDPELVLFGRRLVSKRLRELGHAFAFPTLEAAIGDLCR